MSTATTGTGSPLTLGSAVDGFQTFAAAGVSNGQTVRYTIEDGSNWEIGSGVYSSTGTTLTRVVDESSNAGSAINLSGEAIVFVTAAGDDIQQPPSEGAFADGDKTKLDGIESGATADQTAGEIKTAYESNANTNAFTDAEKTKLSGVETGATADQTASEILTAIKTVDGAGSGLDADLLDGQNGSYYLDYNNFSNTPTIPAAYTDSDVDTHLNTSTAASGEVLSWTGSDYDWVAVSGGATDINGLSDGYSDGSSVGFGVGTLSNVSTNGNNIAIGVPALRGASGTFTGDYNIGLGYLTGDNLSSGSDNTFLGRYSGYNTSSGGNNFFAGYFAGSQVTTSSKLPLQAITLQSGVRLCEVT
jgi:hypothetical protein